MRLRIIVLVLFFVCAGFIAVPNVLADPVLHYYTMDVNTYYRTWYGYGPYDVQVSTPGMTYYRQTDNSGHLSITLECGHYWTFTATGTGYQSQTVQVYVYGPPNDNSFYNPPINLYMYPNPTPTPSPTPPPTPTPPPGNTPTPTPAPHAVNVYVKLTSTDNSDPLQFEYVSVEEVGGNNWTTYQTNTTGWIHAVVYSNRDIYLQYGYGSSTYVLKDETISLGYNDYTIIRYVSLSNGLVPTPVPTASPTPRPTSPPVGKVRVTFHIVDGDTGQGIPFFNIDTDNYYQNDVPDHHVWSTDSNGYADTYLNRYEKYIWTTELYTHYGVITGSFNTTDTDMLLNLTAYRSSPDDLILYMLSLTVKGMDNGNYNGDDSGYYVYLTYPDGNTNDFMYMGETKTIVLNFGYTATQPVPGLYHMDISKPGYETAYDTFTLPDQFIYNYTTNHSVLELSQTMVKLPDAGYPTVTLQPGPTSVYVSMSPADKQAAIDQSTNIVFSNLPLYGMLFLVCLFLGAVGLFTKKW